MVFHSAWRINMKRILLRIAYDGTAYCGWQKQPNGPSVEEAVNRAIKELTGEDTAVVGASRTDSGVHAEGNVAVFDTDSQIPADKFSFALNQRLPSDIAVQESFEVAGSFHPRHAECIKTYEYRILNGPQPNPLWSRYSYHFHHVLDTGLMNEAAQYLIGEHDFAAFCSQGAQVKSTVRTIYSAMVTERELFDSQSPVSPEDCKAMDITCVPGIPAKNTPKIITVRLQGNGFLYNMVRIIAGTLLQAGQGFFEPAHMQEIILSGDRTEAGPTAPPQGLTLKEIRYKDFI